MNRSLLSMMICCGLLVSLCFAMTAFAQEEEDDFEPENKIGGPLYAPQYNATCEKISNKTAQSSHRYSLFANAFIDKSSGTAMCFNILQGESISPRDFTYQISDMKGNLLEELVPPITSSGTKLNYCNIWDIYFDDYNKDAITDIAMLIGCAPPADGNTGQSDNVVYLSTVSEGSVWLRQRQDLNTAVATYTEYEQMEPVIRAVLNGKNYPKPPSTPPTAPSAVPPPPPAPTTPPPASTSAVGGGCHYMSESGPVMLTPNPQKSPVTLFFNNVTGAVTGTFGSKGIITGIKSGTTTTGTWKLGKRKGQFEISNETSGFFGNWKYKNDSDWRGEWEGQFVKCD